MDPQTKGLRRQPSGSIVTEEQASGEFLKGIKGGNFPRIEVQSPNQSAERQ
jgi:hypothetical protein